MYSVPVGGALFALRIVLHTWNIRAVGTALITSGLAVAVAASVTHDAAPLHWPNPDLSYLLTTLAIVMSPLAVAVGTGFNRVMERARRHAVVDSWLLIPGIAAAGLLVGVCSHWLPQLPGNGKSVLTVSLNSGLTLASAGAILLLKPLVTAIFLRAGAVGGMLTPALATGAAMGSLVALSINTWTPVHVSVPAVALSCAAGVLAITQGAPIWAALFVWGTGPPAVVAARGVRGRRGAAHLLDAAIKRRRTPGSPAPA